MKKTIIYQHFEPSEHIFVDRISNYIDTVQETYSYLVTEFLDPRQVDIAVSLITSSGLKYFVSNDCYKMEYSKVIIAPDYYQLDFEDFNIALLQIDYSSKFYEISHAQVLGTLINHLGVKRSVIGDIRLNENEIQIIIDKKLLRYFIDNVTKIYKIHVKLREVKFDSLLPKKEHYQKSEVLVVSLRIDTLLATYLKLSRLQVTKLISQHSVKLNYKEISKMTEQVFVDDVISVRGFGKFKILKDNGISKSGKYKLTIGKLTQK